MRIPAFLLSLPAAGLMALTLLVLPAASLRAEPLSVPFAVEAGDDFTFAVRYLRATTMDGRPNPVVSVDYDLELKITEVDATGIRATVRSHGTNVAVDRQRIIAPPDFDSLVFLAADGLTAELEIAPDGGLVRVVNWEALRGELSAEAARRAGDNPAMIETLDALLPTVSAVDAIQFFARPLAMSAPGRIVTFNPPDQNSVTARGIELPSFATYAAGAWTFDLVRRPDIPDSITIEWLGIPGTEELRAILAPIGEQLERISPLSEETRAEIAANGRMWQRFAATYGAEDGHLVEFQGVMELQAGPLGRRVAIEARAKNR